MAERWWLLVPEYRHQGKLDVVWCGPYKVFQVLNKGENIILEIPAPFNGALQHEALRPLGRTTSVGNF